MMGVSWYAYQRWMLPDLQAGVLEKENEFSDLHKTISILQNEEQLLEKSFIDQKEQEAVLHQKMLIWTDFLKDEQEKLSNLKNQYVHTFATYKKFQYEMLKKIDLQRELQEPILDVVVHNVQKKYSDQHAQHAFIRNVLNMRARG